MPTGFDNSYLTSLFGGSPTAVDLSSLYQGTSGGGTGASTATKYAPTAPWAPTAKASPVNNKVLTTAAVNRALNGAKLVDENSAQLDLKGASADYKKLFALYQSLGTLSGLASQINAKSLTTGEKDRIKTAFSRGLAEIKTYTESIGLDKIRLTEGQVLDSAKTTVGASKAASTYVTPPLVSGAVDNPVDGFAGDVRFNIKITRAGTDHTVAIDLAGLGATPRTLGNVVTFINDKLTAEGVGSRFATQRIPGVDRTVLVRGKPVKVGTTPDAWALKINLDSGDKVAFTPADTEPAIYLAQSVGNPDPDKNPKTADGVVGRQLLKFQADSTRFPSPPQPSGEANWVDGRVWAKDLDKASGAVRATQAGPDGSVYVLTDVTNQIDGQTIKGTQDVALQKYDSAGKLVFSRTLGAASTASGLALAVGPDGQIAVAGKVTGVLSGAIDGGTNSGPTGADKANSDSFVTVYSPQGEEQWTIRRGARANDEATQLAFGSDGAVYVAGRSQSALPGQTALGGWDSYVEGFKTDPAGKPQTLFTQTVGTAGQDHPGGLVVDGSNLILANVEDGRAVLRRFDISTAGALTDTRDLGDLQGGDIAGLALNGGRLVIAGSTSNAALSAGAITSAANGGTDGFVAELRTDLTPDGADALAYYGGSGDDKITGLTVSGGKVYVAGQAGADLPGQPAVGTKDGFVAALDVASGAVGWSRRFSGRDGYATPTAFSVGETGASVLDRLGLPQGQVGTAGSNQLSAISSVRAGDQFVIRNGTDHTRHTITIEVGDSLDNIATKLRRAAGYQADVKIVTTDGVRRLQINPATTRDSFELLAGPQGRDALSGLGLTEGLVRTTVLTKGKLLPADGKGQIYGLKLDEGLNLETASAQSHVAAQLAAAQGVIRQAYNDLKLAATPKSVIDAAKAASQPVSAYYANQIANYQQALARLGG